jgi:hypothetical protein
VEGGDTRASSPERYFGGRWMRPPAHTPYNTTLHSSPHLLALTGGWKAVHDALVMRLVLSRRPPTRPWACWCGGSRRWRRWSTRATDGLGLTDEALRAVSSLPALTSLNLRYCNKVTAAGVQALRSTTATPSLHIEL